ncbi:MAG TPA: FecR family protein [Blastocatellia bacterium]|nr:FecR family protein [Blastocatellia bacterium]
MRNDRVSLAIIVSFLLVAGLSATAKAQYLISTKAGFVNRVEGRVYILRADSEDGEKARASLGSQMREGDRLSVESTSFAEVLLNPGSYLRLSEGSEVRAVSVTLDSVRFELLKGSVITEIGQIDKKTPIEIITPHSALTIAKAGLHRIDAKGNATTVAVRQGEIHVGTRSDFAANQSLKIKSGKVVTLTGTALPGKSDIAKLDKDAIDKFDLWSFNRAEALTAANVRALSRSGVLTSGWYYDPSWNFYTFVPSRSWFSTPYGFAFFNNYRDCYGYTPYYYDRGFYNGSNGRTTGVSVSPTPSQNGSQRITPHTRPRVSPGVVSGIDRGRVRDATDRRVRMSYGDRGGFGDASRPSRGSSQSQSYPGASSGGGGGRQSGGSGGSYSPRPSVNSHSGASSRGAGPGRGRVQ